jgi:hypothetical protein
MPKVGRAGFGRVAWLSGSPEASFESVAEFGFNGGQAGVEQLALWYHDQVEAWRELISTESLSNQSFSSVSNDRAAQLSRRGDPESANRGLIGERKERQEAAVHSDATLVHPLVVDAAADALGLAEPRHFHGRNRPVNYFVLTVRRLRPFARRRLSTCLPFLVLMRTKNPWVLLRRRVLG